MSSHVVDNSFPPLRCPSDKADELGHKIDDLSANPRNRLPKFDVDSVVRNDERWAPKDLAENHKRSRAYHIRRQEERYIALENSKKLAGNGLFTEIRYPALRPQPPTAKGKEKAHVAPSEPSENEEATVSVKIERLADCLAMFRESVKRTQVMTDTAVVYLRGVAKNQEARLRHHDRLHVDVAHELKELKRLEHYNKCVSTRPCL